MGKMIFFEKKSTFFFGGWAGVSVRKWANYEGGARGEAPLHFLVDSFRADG